MVKMYTEFGAAAVGSDGKILAALTDAIQPKITVSAEGEIVSKDYTATKRELGDDYNMVKYGNAIAEWDAQAKAFADYTVGKTADEVMGLDTTTNAEATRSPPMRRCSPPARWLSTACRAALPRR